MAQRTLGIDLGTNSIGWAIIERDDTINRLVDAGSFIFQEGVAREKGNEKPAVETRTTARASRRHYFRRRLRKIELLKVLIANKLCPSISNDALNRWRFKMEYPMDTEFLRWQQTNGNDNPYFARKEALMRKFDLTDIHDRHLLGRALYHLAQRRGFLSNRKDQSKESDGAVKKGINDLSKEMEERGCRYIGEYFYLLYQENKKIRTRYTDRLVHIENEFKAICEKQGLSESLIRDLQRAILYQRPLKSQKGMIGKCIFETNKNRCPVSHPSFEEYRMLAFINNIRIKESGDSDYRPLSNKERELILPLFFRKSKDTFDFEEIAKKIAGKGNYSFRDDKKESAYKFNYRMATSVSGCPVTTGLRGLFGDDWKSAICSCYDLASDKTEAQIINDIWHVMFSFDSNSMLEDWAMKHLQLDENEAKAFSGIKIPQGYASLSLKALNKIIPHLRGGLRYDEAVFVANLDTVLPNSIHQSTKEKIFDDIIDLIINFNSNPLRKEMSKETAVRKILEDVPNIEFKKLDHIYHPSKLDTYPEAEINKDGKILLGSPRTPSVRNPMAMRALFKLRHLINRLLLENKIDRTTRINIEFARGLNDANKRKAIERYQRENEKKHRDYSNEIAKLYKDATGTEIIPTETDILKYTLWKEQDNRCLYTGEQISVTDFIGPNPKYDVEHTIPRSLGGDDSQVNKTLCSSVYNRQIKKSTLPAMLTDHSVIMERIESLGWPKKIEDLANEIAKIKPSNASTKEIKDALIQKRHYLKMQLEYWREKYNRFTMTEVPEGFTNRQGVDIGIIGKYAKEYLRTLFRSEERQIFTVKGMTTAEFRKMWGLQDEYAKKERINHCHHAIDAIVIACIGRREYQLWAEYVRNLETYDLEGGSKPHFEKPWPTFTEDVKLITEQLLVVHDSPDNTLKQSRKILKTRGKQRFDSEDNPLYQQGDTARAKLHKETFYGAIDRGGEVKYVVRVPLNSLTEKDIDKIVDPAVKEKVRQSLDERGYKHLFESPIWMNEEKGIEIKKVRVFTPSVTNPLHIKRHRDLSRLPYKQMYHAANDSNYCIAIYEGSTAKGKIKRSFLLLNNMEAVQRRKAVEDLVPMSDNDDMPLKWILKVGSMVLFYEKSPKELYECTQSELAKRIYIIVGLSTNPVGKGYGVINLRYHQEARPSTDPCAKSKNGIWMQGEDVRPGIIVLHTQFNALVEGQDFTITETGTIKFLYSTC